MQRKQNQKDIIEENRSTIGVPDPKIKSIFDINDNYIRNKYNLNVYRRMNRVVVEIVPFFETVFKSMGIDVGPTARQENEEDEEYDNDESDSHIEGRKINIADFFKAIHQCMPSEGIMALSEGVIAAHCMDHGVYKNKSIDAFELVICREEMKPETDNEVISRLKAAEVKAFNKINKVSAAKLKKQLKEQRKREKEVKKLTTMANKLGIAIVDPGIKS